MKEYSEMDRLELIQAYLDERIYDDNLNMAICQMAGLADEYKFSNADTFEAVVNESLERLGAF